MVSELELQIQGLPIEQRRRVVSQLPRLSFAQERIWLLHQLDHTKSMCNVRYIVRAHGRLDLNALHDAITEVRRRHAVLRTTFPMIDDGLYQVIHGDAHADLAIIDISELPAGERSEEISSRIEAERHEPFDLARGPLFRTLVLRCGPEEHVIIFLFHHIVIDGHSMTLFTSEIAELYDAQIAGRVPHLPQLPIQYADYASWQRQMVQGPVLAKELSYWRERLADCPAISGLPCDFPRSTSTGGGSENLFFQLDPALASRLSELASARRCTRYMLMLAAFAATLGRLAEVSDLCIGSPVAGRVRSEFEPLIGCFLNTLVMRFKLSGAMTFDDLLQQSRELTMGAYANQTVPFERIVDELRPTRGANATPFFQVMINMLGSRPRPLKFGGLELIPVGLGEPHNAGVDLSMKVQTEAPNGIGIFFSYRTDLFERATIVDLRSEFTAFLAQVVQQPQLPILSMSRHAHFPAAQCAAGDEGGEVHRSRSS